MSASANTTAAEKLHHAIMISRSLWYRSVDRIWDIAEDKHIFRTFIHRCVREVNLDFDQLRVIHVHDLQKIFDDFRMSIKERCVVRKYLSLPDDAIWALISSIGLLSVPALLARIWKTGFGNGEWLKLAVAAALGIGVYSLGNLITEKLRHAMADCGEHGPHLTGSVSKSNMSDDAHDGFDLSHPVKRVLNNVAEESADASELLTAGNPQAPALYDLSSTPTNVNFDESRFVEDVKRLNAETMAAYESACKAKDVVAKTCGISGLPSPLPDRDGLVKLATQSAAGVSEMAVCVIVAVAQNHIVK